MPVVSAEPLARPLDAALVAVVLLVGTDRLDVALPAHLTVAELVAEICEVALRAGVDVPASPVLARSGRGVLAAEQTLHTHGVRDGDVLVLQERASRAPLEFHHEVARVVGASVGGQVITGEHLKGVALVGLALWGLALALLAPALGAWGPALCLGAAVGAAVVALGPGVDGVPALRAVCAGVFVGHSAWGGWLWAASGADVPGAWGAGGGLLVAGAVMSWSRPGLREWATTPAVVGAVVVLAGVPGTLGWPVAAGTMASALALLLLLGSGLLRVWMVDAMLLGRGVAGSDPASERVVSTARMLLALDAAVLAAWCCATPSLVTGSVCGVLLWGAGAVTFLLRARSENLLARAAMAWCAGGVVLLLGLLVALVAPGPGWTPAVLGTTTAVTVVAVLPISTVLRGRAASAHTARAASACELLLRVATPSLWLLQSGLLPGGGR